MLSRCIAVDPATFARDHWGCRPLLSRAATLPQGFDDLLSARMVDELIAERGVRAPFIRMARDGDLVARNCYLGPGGFGAEMPDQVDSAKVLAQFAAGATIVLQGLHRLWPPLIDFVGELVGDLGHPVQANAYVTPPESRGFDAHYDVHDVFVLQTAGRKQWRVHEPVHRDPLPSQPWTDHRAAVEARAHDDPVIDTVLGPGDALYLPRGWIHSAQALGETSIHITVGVAATTVHDVIAAIVDELGTVDDLRASLPIGIDPTDRDEAVAIATKTMATLVEVLRDRAPEIGEGVATRSAARHAAATRPPAVRPLATLDSAAQLDVDTRLRWRRGLVATIADAGDRVELRLADRVMSFPHFCADALGVVRSGADVVAGDLPRLDAADGVVLLRRLLREAVVVPTAATDAPGTPTAGREA
ncbi:cupin domain-containing protein [Gordonia insulae]|uniref:50S ribosomal protein L16 3-hydroxylase n=1 Tax=Gordonia insulae TaxID=2420509 RepID=A0A3G8JFT9_9ACTN|nr:cupin domain-containing protein [Gordonia insulae]AZG43788.1 50S ribosomal protein L16 3-hydroxylase [Gordonia insulae]